MEDGLEGLSLNRVSKNNGAKGGALQGPTCIEDPRAKMIAYGGEDGGIGGGQLASAGVSVEDAQSRIEPGETSGEGCLAGGNSARDTENWHVE